jgi:hypothetical protein
VRAAGAEAEHSSMLAETDVLGYVKTSPPCVHLPLPVHARLRRGRARRQARTLGRRRALDPDRA